MIIIAATKPSPLTTLDFAAYDPVTHDIHNDVVVGNPDIYLGTLSEKGFGWIDVAPGTYVIMGVTQKEFWGLCLARDTQAFTVHAGETIYLGKFDPAPMVAVLTNDVLAKGQAVVQNGAGHSYFDGAPAMRMDQTTVHPDDAGSLSVSTTQAISGVRTAALVPAHFRTGTTLFGEPVCGGYDRK